MGITRVVISHRPGTVEIADKILDLTRTLIPQRAARAHIPEQNAA